MEDQEKKENIVEKLISGFSSEDQFEIKKIMAKSRLKVKILTTLLFKENIYEDFTELKKKSYLCQSNCYQKVNLKDLETLEKQTSKLQNCIRDCTIATEDVKNYLENTDFMSIFKLEYCAEGCFSETKPDSIERLDCYFDCYARLDRRYRGYWLKHRNKLINRYYYDLYEEEI